ncbi:hypothetical protein PNBC_06165 [Paenibacillus crassostreae]|uniref:L,D-TPase catalytic domain-containing protein n=1 Tax=Paenibacillus crassostreae TaxID=1763538 RepID=A0A167FWM3_9BACL|nr:hypothetical protein LPB68_18570 [Paenibacillus crassostreae]OAB76974.1 hypothetical protein PNBC_06165 [Paenibacillus crassostreae]
MKNSIFLKKYVEQHPENKMGWYLLGKEYEKNGEEGKANYCFNQSSDVYEAFEHSRVPDDVWKEYQDRLFHQSRNRERRTYKIRLLLLTLMFLFLILAPLEAPGVTVASIPAEKQTLTNDTEKNQADNVTEVKVKDTASINIPTFTAQHRGSSQETARNLALLLDYSSALPIKMAVLGMERKDKWLIWKQNMPLTYTLDKMANAQIVFQSYDPMACDCTPPDATDLKASALEWVKKQEQLVALSGAIRFFVQENGRLPARLEELSQPFPNNVISGSTEVMEQYFDTIKARYTSSTTLAGNTVTLPNKEDSGSTTNDNTSSNVGDDVFFEQPLEIIVDKANHRLAVVSGNILLRNYEVGLGGGKTPEEDFVISEKVVNPNGSSNGEFGSRGMQLSTSNYAIHGTDEPNSIGLDESNGCIRMTQEDVEELFDLVPMGTKVSIVKGVLPDELLVPTERYKSRHRQDQTNPLKTYHWLN